MALIGHLCRKCDHIWYSNEIDQPCEFCFSEETLNLPEQGAYNGEYDDEEEEIPTEEDDEESSA